MHFLFLMIFFSNVCFCQTNILKNQFTINGTVTGKDTGKIVLNYYDGNNRMKFDTTIIKNGRFVFSGTVNVVSDANLWTDLKNTNFGDKSIIRFLLEANKISIFYREGFVAKALVQGSKSHTEWEKWEEKKAKLIISNSQYISKANSIYKLSKSDTTQLGNLKLAISSLDSVNLIARAADLDYILQHNNSYLSAFMLSRHKRRLSIDTIEYYFSKLSKNVKTSNVGYTVLEYVYPLSDNILFKKANPLNGIKFNEKLNLIKSVHDLVSKDPDGKNVEFSRFKGNYILIDFWASWCKACIEDVPYLRKIIEEFKNDSIRFVSVSIDSDGKKWKKAIAQNNLNWLQVSELSGFQGVVPTYCKIIIGIPQYVLVDKFGKIINFDAPRPEKLELRLLLNKLLNKEF